MWKIKIPNKIRVFLWRLLKNALPTLDNLERKMVLLDNVCPVCSCDRSALHLLTDCAHARCLWALTGLSKLVYTADKHDIWEWICSIRQQAAPADFEVFVVATWSIWGNRNKLVH